MEVIGRGFLAGHLAAIADRHPAVTVLAAGVSSTVASSPAAFEREAALVRDTLRRCRADRRLLVFLSTASTALYQGDGTGVEGRPVHPVSAYGRHKLGLEERVQNAGPGWLVLRLAHLVGPDQRPHQLLPYLVGRIRAGSLTVQVGARRDLIDVAHVVSILDGLLARGVRDEVVNIASGQAAPIERIVRGIEARLDRTATWELVPTPPTAVTVSLAKLRTLVDLAPFRFDSGYLDRLLDRHVPVIAAELDGGGRGTAGDGPRRECAPPGLLRCERGPSDLRAGRRC